MAASRNTGKTLLTLAALAACLLGPGCVHNQPLIVPPAPVPKEQHKEPFPEYVIEPPDLLLIDALRVVPKPPYRIQPLDSIYIRALNVLMDEPISALYPVQPDGLVDLGPSYGTVRVADMTIEEARDAILRHLKDAGYKNATVSVSLGQTRGLQQIQGVHLVRPDGTVSLGLYGNVSVVGLTITEAKARIEEFLSQFLVNPAVAVDVYAYNSKWYYIVTDGGGFGEQVYRFPSTGNETVLDAMSQIYGLPAVSNPKHIWVARPHLHHPDEILPVDWRGITRLGEPKTNYQVLPGDRIYVKANPLVTLDTFLARLYSPIERTFGITLLGNSTVRSFTNANNGTGNGLGTGF